MTSRRRFVAAWAVSDPNIEQRAEEMFGVRPDLRGRGFITPSGTVIVVPRQYIHAEAAWVLLNPPKSENDIPELPSGHGKLYAALDQLLVDGWVRVDGEGHSLFLQFHHLTSAQRETIMDSSYRFAFADIETPHTGRRGIRVDLTGKASMAKALRDAQGLGEARLRALRHHPVAAIARRNRR